MTKKTATKKTTTRAPASVARKAPEDLSKTNKSEQPTPAPAAKPRALTAKQAFKSIKPADSANVEIYFDKVFRAPKNMKYDGHLKKLADLGHVSAAIVKLKGDESLYVLPYKITAERLVLGEKSLKQALKTRGIEIV